MFEEEAEDLLDKITDLTVNDMIYDVGLGDKDFLKIIQSALQDAYERGYSQGYKDPSNEKDFVSRVTHEEVCGDFYKKGLKRAIEIVAKMNGDWGIETVEAIEKELYDKN